MRKEFVLHRSLHKLANLFYHYHHKFYFLLILSLKINPTNSHVGVLLLFSFFFSSPSLQFEPKDKRSQIFLRNRILENKTIHGTVTVEISPCQNYASKCSYVFEVPELGSGSRSKNYRVWWAALVDSNFMLFKKYGDPHPYRTLAVLKIMWYTPAKTCIRISSMKGDDAIIFACSDPSDTSNWYNKLRQLVD